MREKISVIVPVYGVEKMLARCVESILAQTYENIELVLVDDGSPDQCPAMCDQYAEKYKNIVVIHKKNGGLTSAWKAGVTAATGDLLGFVDSDDWIDPDTVLRIPPSKSVRKDTDIVPTHNNVSANKIYFDGIVNRFFRFILYSSRRYTYFCSLVTNASGRNSFSLITRASPLTTHISGSSSTFTLIPVFF